MLRHVCRRFVTTGFGKGIHMCREQALSQWPDQILRSVESFVLSVNPRPWRAAHTQARSACSFAGLQSFYSVKDDTQLPMEFHPSHYSGHHPSPIHTAAFLSSRPVMENLLELSMIQTAHCGIVATGSPPLL
ncbi:hypothetical protein H920_17768 [Fukomys damarensis]|uniref:Uncharacterized protein n=1 Tax=Fukomys damarensis TaxID=885580 RepID=A0A091CRK2_FUKDA|nr:hypothetical protein H920_17768 [Fukomys damarensis]